MNVAPSDAAGRNGEPPLRRLSWPWGLRAVSATRRRNSFSGHELAQPPANDFPSSCYESTSQVATKKVTAGTRRYVICWLASTSKASLTLTLTFMLTLTVSLGHGNVRQG
jgi:hypothetical protein